MRYFINHLAASSREHDPHRQPAPGEGAAPKGVRRGGQHASWRPERYRARDRLLKARERLSDPERRRLSELFPNASR